MYSLILIGVMSDIKINAELIGRYDSMIECFEARDRVMEQYRNEDGTLKRGVQAVCIEGEV